MAPAKTPQPIVDSLNAEIRKIMARPEIKDAWGRQGAMPMTMTPPEFEKYLNADIAKWAKVVSAAGAGGEVRLEPVGGNYRQSSTETVLRSFAPMMRQ